MRESTVEMKLRKRVEAEGGVCWKWTSPGRIGVPDRIVIFPGGRVAFVELKRPGGHERKSQVRVQRMLRELGCTVFSSVDGDERIQAVIDWEKGGDAT